MEELARRTGMALSSGRSEKDTNMSCVRAVGVSSNPQQEACGENLSCAHQQMRSVFAKNGAAVAGMQKPPLPLPHGRARGHGGHAQLDVFAMHDALLQKEDKEERIVSGNKLAVNKKFMAAAAEAGNGGEAQPEVMRRRLGRPVTPTYYQSAPISNESAKLYCEEKMRCVCLARFSEQDTAVQGNLLSSFVTFLQNNEPARRATVLCSNFGAFISECMAMLDASEHVSAVVAVLTAIASTEVGQQSLLVSSIGESLLVWLLRHVRDGSIVKGREMVYLLEQLNQTSRGQNMIQKLKGKENRRPPGARQPPSEEKLSRPSFVRTPWG